MSLTLRSRDALLASCKHNAICLKASWLGFLLNGDGPSLSNVAWELLGRQLCHKALRHGCVRWLHA